MLKKFGFENISKSRSATGLEIIILADGSYELNIVVLKKDKAALITEKQNGGIHSFEEAARLIDSKAPLILILNGKGVINKKVSTEESDSPTKLLNKVFPNANLNEFNIQQTPCSSAQTFISVIRVSVLNEIIEKLKINKLTNISGCLLGPFVLNNVVTLIDKKNIQNEVLSISNFQLLIKDQEIIEIENAPSDVDTRPILISDETVPSSLVIAFAGALSYFIGNSDGIINSEEINELKEEFTQKRKFEMRGMALLVSVFLILIGNYFVFNNYWSKSNEMESRLASNQSAVEHYDVLKKEFSQKKEFVEQNGLLETSRTSYYADKLASGLPASIQFTDVDIHPLKKKEVGDETKALFFESKIINVSGKCQRNTELNDWMKKLKQEPWIHEVALVNYNQNNENDEGLFLLKVKLN